MKSREELNKIEDFTLAVDVTQDDINNGIRQDCNKCPFALAIIRAMNAAELPIDVNSCDEICLEVDAANIEVDIKGVFDRFKYIPSPEVEKWIHDFDAGFNYKEIPMSPINVTMKFHKDIPEDNSSFWE